MKRVIGAALLAAAAFSAPASAYEPIGVQPVVSTGENGRYGAGFNYRTNGGRWEPGLHAYVGGGQACAGFGHQMPICTPPVEIGG